MVLKKSPNESRDSSRDQIIRRKKTIVRTLLAFVTIANVLIFAYVGSVIYSVSKTSVVLVDTGSYAYNSHEPLNFNDDTFDYTLNLTLGNLGIYPIQPITLYIEVYVNNSSVSLLVPNGTFFGSLDQTIPAVNPGTITNQSMILAVNATTALMASLVGADVTLRTEFTIDTAIQQFSLHIAGMFYQTQHFGT
jgi:hypothetical protein